MGEINFLFSCFLPSFFYPCHFHELLGGCGIGGIDGGLNFLFLADSIYVSPCRFFDMLFMGNGGNINLWRERNII